MIEARVEIIRRPKATTEDGKPKSKQITMEEFNKLMSREYLLIRLKADKNLSEDIRKRMIRALAKDFSPKYKRLIAAYYASFLNEETDE